MSTRPRHGAEEIEQLSLLRALQEILARALDSLAGKLPTTPESAYLGWAAVSVNRAADGFLCLRDSRRVAASKLLVRPALEATFAAIAVLKKDGFLFRQAYSEWEEDKKMCAEDAAGEQEAEKKLEALKRAFRQNRPTCLVECKRVTVRDAADAAGFLEIYASAYRIYCRFTHGALRAVVGDLDDTTDTIDTPIVTWCALQVIDHLQTHTPDEIPDLIPFRKRLLNAHQRRSPG